MMAQTGAEMLDVTYRGQWEGYTRIRTAVENALSESQKRNVSFRFDTLYKNGVPPQATLQAVREILVQLGLNSLGFTAKEKRDE